MTGLLNLLLGPVGTPNLDGVQDAGLSVRYGETQGESGFADALGHALGYALEPDSGHVLTDSDGAQAGPEGLMPPIAAADEGVAGRAHQGGKGLPVMPGVRQSAAAPASDVQPESAEQVRGTTAASAGDDGDLGPAPLLHGAVGTLGGLDQDKVAGPDRVRAAAVKPGNTAADTLTATRTRVTGPGPASEGPASGPVGSSSSAGIQSAMRMDTPPEASLAARFAKGLDVTPRGAEPGRAADAGGRAGAPVTPGLRSGAGQERANPNASTPMPSPPVPADIPAPVSERRPVTPSSERLARPTKTPTSPQSLSERQAALRSYASDPDMGVASRLATSDPAGRGAPGSGNQQMGSVAGPAGPAGPEGTREPAVTGTAIRAAGPTQPLWIRPAAEGIEISGAGPQAIRPVESGRAQAAVALSGDGLMTEAAAPLVRSASGAADIPAAARASDIAQGASLNLADAGEAAETLIERMLQSQARQSQPTSIRFQLRPLELGQLDVQMKWRGDQLHVAFTAQQSVARDLIESYMPHLRQMMQDMGLQLGDADVRLDPDLKEGQRQLAQQSGQQMNGQRDGRDQRQPETQPSASTSDRRSETVAGEADVPPRHAGQAISGIDAFV